MNKRERKQLRRSILEGLRGSAYFLLVDEHHTAADIWDGPDGKRWEGPEVVEECQAVYDALVKWIKERR